MAVRRGQTGKTKARPQKRTKEALRAVSAATAKQNLEAWMPPEVRHVIATLAKRGARGVLVGGGVRDAFLNRRPPDWDVATDAEPSQVARWFPRVARTGEQHGTIMVLTGATSVEVTTFRGEGPYLDGRRPSHVVFLADLEADLARRDLTINAIAYDVVRQVLVDPFAGERDLRARVVRCVGDAVLRFGEDGLRPLRAVRFAATLGFAVEAATEDAIGKSIGTFERVAWERKRVEIEKLLANGRAFAVPLRLLASSGMLAQLAPELSLPSSAKEDKHLEATLQALPAGDAWLRFAAWCVLRDVDAQAAGEIATRWRSSKNDARRIEQMLMAFDELPKVAPTGPALRQWVARASWSAADDAAQLARALRGSAYTQFPARLKRLAGTKPVVSIADLAIDGTDLGALGITGRAVGETLRALLEKVLQNPRDNHKPRLESLARSLSTAKPTS